jgi:uncharacterized membrane protein YfcA
MPGPIITKNPRPVAAVAVAIMILIGFLLLGAGILEQSTGEALFGLFLCGFGIYNWVRLARAEARDRKRRRKGPILHVRLPVPLVRPLNCEIEAVGDER